MLPMKMLALSASVTALMLGGATAASAQSTNTAATAAEAGQGAALEEVVVTARRREESQQSVPVAVTAITGKTLEKKNITDLITLSRQVPNVSIGGASTNAQLLTVGIRGIRQKEGHIFFDGSVVVIQAETVLDHPYGAGEELYDLASLQILKGPQGTLFGRNTTAGAVVITPNYASISEGFHGSAQASLGSYNRQKYDLVVNAPLGDTAAFRVAAEHFSRRGYMTNVMNGDHWGGIGNNSVRASLTWEPASNLRNVTVADYIREKSSPNGLSLVALLPGGSGSLLGGAAATQRLVADQQTRNIWHFATYAGTGLPQDEVRAGQCRPGTTAPFQPVCNPADLKDTFSATVEGVSNRTEWDLGSATLKNITSFRRFKRSTYQASWIAASPNFAGGPGNQSITGSIPQKPWVETFTEEVNLSGKAFDHLNYTTGFFYMHDHGHERNFSFQGIGLAIPTSANFADSTLTAKSYGIYAQATYALTDKFNLTGGIRYNHDRKIVQQGNYNIDVVSGAFTCNLFNGQTATKLPNVDAQCQLYGNKHWNAVTWTAAADYHILPDTMLYASVTRGYRAGSFFPRAVRTRLFAYDPEFVMSYEAGLKSEWRLMGQPVRTNLAFYRANISDMQVQVQDVTTVPLSGFIANAGRARYQGGEFEVTYRPTDALTLTGYASYTDFKYLSYFDGVSDLSYQTAPEPISHWAVGGSAEYHFDLQGQSGLDLRADVAWTSKVVTNNISPNAKGDWPGPAYTIVNLRADWTKPFDTPVTLGLWVTNLTNDWYNAGGTCLSGICYITPSPPRMWGVDLRYEF